MRSSRTLCSALLLCALLAVIAAAPRPHALADTSTPRESGVVALAESAFLDGDDGWQVVALPRGRVWAPSQADGVLSADAQGSEDLWYWQAPPPFLGDRSAAYGGFLTFSLREVGGGAPVDGADVLLEGGGMTLAGQLAPAPGPEWTPYRLPLEVGAGWTHAATGRAATAEELEGVLRELTALRIRGRYRAGDATGSLAAPRVVAAGRRPGPKLKLNPRQRNFKGVPVGQIKTQFVRLTNTGDETAAGQVVFSDPYEVFSGVTGSVINNFQLEPGQSLALGVRFKPKAVGSFNAQIRFVDAAGILTLAKLGVKGKGTRPGPSLEASQAVLDYGEVAVNGEKRLTVDIDNVGTTDIVGTIRLTGPFFFRHGIQEGPFTLKQGETATPAIDFRPTTPGRARGEMTIDDLLGVRQVRVRLQGRAAGSVAQPLLSVSPGSLVFPDTEAGQRSTRRLVFSGTGAQVTAQLRVEDLNNPRVFVTPITAVELDPGESVEVDVHFEPGAMGGNRTGKLIVTSNGGNFEIPLSGKGLDGPMGQLVVNPQPELSFGAIRVGRRISFGVNTDAFNAPVTFRVTPLEPPFSHAFPASVTVPPARSDSVAFAPTAEGEFTATLRFLSADGTRELATLRLRGVGLPAEEGVRKRRARPRK